MADRFPSLDDFDSGGKTCHLLLAWPGPILHHLGWLTLYFPAQTDVKDVSASADDFLAREQALLGDDAAQFTTGNDSAAFVDTSDDLLGGGEGGDVSHLEQSQFQNQFPDINSGNQVRAPSWFCSIKHVRLI